MAPAQVDLLHVDLLCGQKQPLAKTPRIRKNLFCAPLGNKGEAAARL